MLIEEQLTKAIIGAAIEVHRELGPGLLESAYEECLWYELHLRGLNFERQAELPVAYKGLKLDCGYRLDIVVENSVLLELKSIEQIFPVHHATAHIFTTEREESGSAYQLQCWRAEEWNREKGSMTCLLRAPVSPW
jgi:GxxExxY protein